MRPAVRRLALLAAALAGLAASTVARAQPGGLGQTQQPVPPVPGDPQRTIPEEMPGTRAPGDVKPAPGPIQPPVTGQSGGGAASGQSSQNSPATPLPATPATPAVPQPRPGETLSDRLNRTDGVITPRSNIDPDIRVPAPVPNPNTTPVIPPPGSPGNPSPIEPK